MYCNEFYWLVLVSENLMIQCTDVELLFPSFEDIILEKSDFMWILFLLLVVTKL